MGEYTIRRGEQKVENPTERTKMKIRQVSKMIANFYPKPEIIEYIKATFKVGDESARNYYDAALNYLVPTDQEEQEQRQQITALIVDTINDAKINGDRKNALYGADLLNKLNQRYMSKIEAVVTTDNEVKFNFGDKGDNEQKR